MTINFLLLVGSSSIVNASIIEENIPTIPITTSSLLTTKNNNGENYKVSAHKGTKILIPSNINIRIFLVTKPIKLNRCIDNIHQQEDKVATILGLFVYAHARHMQRDASEVDDYIPLSSTILQHHIYDYSDYLQYLMDNSIFETDSFYIPDEKCYGYRLAEKYRNAPLVEYFISNYHGNNKNGAAVCNSFYKPNKEQKETINKYQALYNDLCNVTIPDFYAAQDYIKNELQDVALESVIKDFKKRRDCSWTKYKEGDQTLKQQMIAPRILGKQNCWISSIHALDQKHLYFKQDTTSHRLHTSVLGVKTECRKFLRLEGNEIVSCDLKNSQPFISSVLFTKGDLTPEIMKILIKCLSCLKKADITIYKSIISRIKQYKSGDILPSTQQYLRLVKNGEIYEFLAIKLNQLESESSKKHKVYFREDGKHLTFTLFFNPSKFGSLARDIFRQSFPQVMSLFEDINILFTHTRRECDRMKVPYKQNTLAILLQSIESHIFIDVICKNMKEKYPQIPLLTVHDAIGTNSEFIMPLKLEMEETLQAIIGSEPTLKIEKWT